MGIFHVETRYGSLRGVQKIGYCVFRGVPYSKAPLGQLRWKRPEPLEPWKGLREAKVFASRPIEPGHSPDSFYGKEFFLDEDFIPHMSEDCLYLNIWTPAEKADEKLPVAFWIHGGGFINGYASEPEFDGAAFAKQGVILVTVGHRVGVLGYLAHPWFSAESGGISGNYGLYDLIAALDWVRENSALFGGDPERISIFGQSAGAISVQALVSSQCTKGKIQGAIIQSGGGYNPGLARFRSFAAAEAMGKQFSDFCGVTSLEEFRAIPGEQFVELQAHFITRWAETYPNEQLPFGPCIDKLLLEASDSQLLEQGAHHDIPYMIGCTARDISSSPEQAKAGERPPLFYVCTGFSALNETLGRCPAYTYFFTHEPEGDDAGAFHSAELWYVFGTLDRSWRPKRPADYELSAQMVSYWCNFFKSGNPNGTGLPLWKPCKKEDPFVMHLPGDSQSARLVFHQMIQQPL